jgi:hypothetical protein
VPLPNLRPMYAALVVVALSTGLAACGSESSSPESSGLPEIRALRFAGVDLEYALERVAAEAGMPLALDEIKPKDMSPDLALYRVDLDLPAGPVDAALRALQTGAGGFEFEIVDGVIYVRSQLSLAARTPLDLPLLPEKKFKGGINELVAHILASLPTSFVTVERVVGGPEGPVVEIEIPDKSSVKDAFVQYARASKLNWAIRRAGFVVDDANYGKAIVGTTIELRRPRMSVSRLPAVYNKESTLSSLASASARLKAPMLVLDRSVVMNTRGFLNLSAQADPLMPLVETLDELGASGWGPESWHFKWKMEDGVPVIESSRFLYMLAGRDLFREELLGGDFEGTLPEFARWVNAHMKNPSGDVLMGGEITPDQPRTSLTIASGTTVQQALIEFTKASKISPYVALLDLTNPVSGQQVAHPHAWKGAYLQDLAEWLPATPSGAAAAP